MELAQVEFFLEESNHSAFLETYRNQAGPTLLEELERGRALCRGLFHLRQSIRNISEERRLTHRERLWQECS